MPIRRSSRQKPGTRTARRLATLLPSNPECRPCSKSEELDRRMSSELPNHPPVTPRLKICEPFNGLSHLLGAFLGIAALIVLVCLARGKPWHLSAFAIYGRR